MFLFDGVFLFYFFIKFIAMKNLKYFVVNEFYLFHETCSNCPYSWSFVQERRGHENCQ